MTYVTSDLHGLEVEALKALLRKADFSDGDRLFILGDVIDRQNDGGLSILTWLLDQPNARLILGNHEAMLLSCGFEFEETVDVRAIKPNKRKRALLANYKLNGGDVTIKAFMALKEQDPATAARIWQYLKEAPLYVTVTVGGKHFLLCHSGLDHFSPEKRLSDYSADAFLWAWPEMADRYFEDRVTVFGHTPTFSFGEEYRGKILKTDTWIDIDVGVTYGNRPVLLRLDDLKEFHAE